MQAKTIGGSLAVLLLLMALTLAPRALAVDYGVGIGGASCTDVQRRITRDWFELKHFFRPDVKSAKRPRSREYYCVSPRYTVDAIPARSMSLSLKCYTVQGQKFCCDSRLQQCAGLI